MLYACVRLCIRTVNMCESKSQVGSQAIIFRLLRAQDFLVGGILNKSWPQVAEFRCCSNAMSLEAGFMLGFTESEIKYSIKMVFVGFWVWAEIILSEVKYLDSYYN